MSDSIRIECLRSLVFDGGRFHDVANTSIHFLPAALSSDWLHEMGATPDGLLDLVVWITLGLNARPLVELAKTGFIQPGDESQLGALVAVPDVAQLLGRTSDEIERAIARLVRRGWLSVRTLPSSDTQSAPMTVVLFALPPAADSGQPPSQSVQVMPLDRRAISSQVFARFATRRKLRAYTPTAADRQALEHLLEAGYSLDDILAGIERAFRRKQIPQHFAYCEPVIQDRPPHRSFSANSLSVPARLVPAMEILHQVGYPLSPDLVTRLQLMAEGCEIAAQQHDSTGAQWLVNALTLGVGVADDLLKYATGVLRNWVQSGPGARPDQSEDTPPSRDLAALVDFPADKAAS